ncbi:MAG: hypothetical protein IPL19_21185 [Sandaracinaceae bacterium]|nr:hypothetical protein [Sandaracinaceae bacterium]
MLAAVHTAQVVLTLISARLVVRKLRQLGGPGTPAQHQAVADRMLAALREGNAPTLATLLAEPGPAYQRELLEAAIDGLDGGGDVGSFIHTASLDAQHRALAGARVIRGFATLSSALGLVGAMAHHFWLLHSDHGPSTAALLAAEKSANAGALVSMGIGLGTALLLYLASRVIRTRVLARLSAISRFAAALEAAALRCEQWTEPAGG